MTPDRRAFQDQMPSNHCWGCGMCEAACADHLPLTAIFARIREELLAEPA